VFDRDGSLVIILDSYLVLFCAINYLDVNSQKVGFNNLFGRYHLIPAIDTCVYPYMVGRIPLH
jgi:hypothetical protein